MFYYVRNLTLSIPYEHIIWTVCDILHVFCITCQISLWVTGLELYDRWIFNIFYDFYVPKSIHKPLSPSDLINLICFNELEHRYNFSWIIQYYWHYKKCINYAVLCFIYESLKQSESWFIMNHSYNMNYIIRSIQYGPYLIYIIHKLGYFIWFILYDWPEKQCLSVICLM